MAPWLLRWVSDMFNFGGQRPQSTGLNLSATGAPQQWQQPQQQGFGVFGAQQQQQWQQPQQQAPAPPSEMELMNALLQSQNPIHRFIASGGLASVIDLVATATSLSVLSVLKDATFVLDDDEGAMKLDTASLPDNLKTLSAENVGMLLNQMVNNSQQTIQQAEMQRQQILAVSQQSAMGARLSAALADENTLEKAGNFFGNMAGRAIGTR